MIAVSHDRYFLDRVVNRIFSFEGDGLLHQSEGGYEEYLARKEGEEDWFDAGQDARASSLGLKPGVKTGQGAAPEPGRAKADPEPGRAKADSEPGRAKTDPEPGVSKKNKKPRLSEPRKKLTFSQQREYDTIEGVIDALTEKSQELEAEMAAVTSDYVKLQALSKEKQKVDAELEEKIERYIELQELVEELQG